MWKKPKKEGYGSGRKRGESGEPDGASGKENQVDTSKEIRAAIATLPGKKSRLGGSGEYTKMLNLSRVKNRRAPVSV